MSLTILLFAGLRERLKTSQLKIALPPDRADAPTVGDLLSALARAHPEIRELLPHCRVALDQEFADSDQPIRPDQEIALIPPVSGGHDGPQDPAPIDHAGKRARLRSTALSLAEVVAAVEHPGAGGLTTFTGNVREHSRGKTVKWLEYEAYPAMAVAKMDEISLAIESEIPGTRVAVQHRVGRLEIGETAVVIAASAPHRAEAFAACREVIERLKRDVPIWKKEIDTQGDAWIGQGP